MTPDPLPEVFRESWASRKTAHRFKYMSWRVAHVELDRTLSYRKMTVVISLFKLIGDENNRVI